MQEDEMYLSPYGDDIKQIRSFLEEKGLYIASARKIYELYSQFSDDCYCAGWLCFDADTLEEFWNYVWTRIKDGDIQITVLN